MACSASGREKLACPATADPASPAAKDVPEDVAPKDGAEDVSEDGALIIRDFGSYHGTTVNGTTLGGEGRPRTAPLMTGESELITGEPDSPFRFRIVVD